MVRFLVFQQQIQFLIRKLSMVTVVKGFTLRACSSIDRYAMFLIGRPPFGVKIKNLGFNSYTPNPDKPELNIED